MKEGWAEDVKGSQLYPGITEVEVDGFGVANVQNAVGLRGETGHDLEGNRALHVMNAT